MTSALSQDKRFLINLALEAGKKYLSPQTGLIHFCYQDERSSDTIPLYENLCYCLALFRTVIGDNIQEAKQRLFHLLAFKREGKLPTYLHEYPQLGWSTKTTFPLLLILKHYGTILGDQLRKELQELAPPPSGPDSIASSKDGTLRALHLQHEEKSLDPIAPFWDPVFQTYSGPLNDEFQRGKMIDVTLFDLFMAEAHGTFSPRLLKPHPIHLHAALVFPSLHPLKPCHAIHSAPIPHGRGFHHFRNIWQEGEELLTWVCQDKKLTYKEGTFTYPEELPDDKERSELNFYVSEHPSIDIQINGEKGTVFRLGDRVQIAPGKSFSLELTEGEGDFLGHISKGNRPAQLLTHDFTAYDWKISLRTLRRSQKIKICLKNL